MHLEWIWAPPKGGRREVKNPDDRRSEDGDDDIIPPLEPPPAPEQPAQPHLRARAGTGLGLQGVHVGNGLEDFSRSLPVLCRVLASLGFLNPIVT